MSAHMFAGASTPIGFVDLFDHVLPVKGAKKRLFLKGASGSGKSTFIKKVAVRFEKAGIEVERFHCANDTHSLDAIAVPSVGLSIVDATSPHAHDPEIAVVVDKILDFAEFLDESKLEPYLDELKSLAANKKLFSKKVAGYLVAAGSMYKAENSAFEDTLDKQAIKRSAYNYFDELIECAQPTAQCDKAHFRKLFLSALTPDGYISFADKLFEGCRVYGIACDIGCGSNIFLNELSELAISHKISIINFYSPIDPAQIEYVYFPQISTAFACVSGHFTYSGVISELIDLNEYVNMEMLESTKILEPDCGIFDRVIDKTISAMYCARKLHARTEDIYVSAMDFDALNKASEVVINDLLGLIE